MESCVGVGEKSHNFGPRFSLYATLHNGDAYAARKGRGAWTTCAPPLGSEGTKAKGPSMHRSQMYNNGPFISKEEKRRKQLSVFHIRRPKPGFSPVPTAVPHLRIYCIASAQTWPLSRNPPPSPFRVVAPAPSRSFVERPPLHTRFVRLWTGHSFVRRHQFVRNGTSPRPTMF